MPADRNPARALLTLLIALLSLLGSPSPALAETEAEPDAESESGSDSDSDSGSDSDSDAESKSDAAPDPAADADAAFDAILKENLPDPAAPAEVPAPEPSADGATVELPLAEYTDAARRLGDLRRAGARPAGPPVVLGAAHYDGEVSRGVLALRVELHVTLFGDGFKAVPLVGDDVALASASADRASIGVTRRPGYHVWITDRSGPVELELHLLVPQRGPRGGSEYSFRAARTPSTSLSIRVPGKDLAPRLDGAVLSELHPVQGGTEVRATLPPTTAIRLVGFRDLDRDLARDPGQEERQSARVYAETSTLLSADERSTDLFTVARYHILHAPAQTFEIFIPAGLEVLSADGEGAFRYVLEPQPGGALLRGETAYPVQGSYELSLRLRHRRAAAAPSAREEVALTLPRCIGVEREHGWLAVEVPGKLRLEELSRQDLAAVDARQLPGDLAAGAVSPILRAYRYHRPSPSLRLSMERLPEEELPDGVIDRLDALSVLTAEGKLLTELRITLRNALRPTLALTLPPATEARGARLAGEPVKPSLDAEGRLLLPLQRSRGDERLEPFTVEVLLETSLPPLGLFGRAALALPATDLTAASLRWQLLLPASNEYGELHVAGGKQVYAGAASWHKPAHQTRAVRWDEADGDGEESSPRAASLRAELPQAGVERETQRYWIAAGEAPRVEVRYLRASLLLPLELLLAALALGGIALSARRWLRPRLATSLAAARAALALLPARLRAWRRRQVWTRRRAARALGSAALAAAAAWMLLSGLLRLAGALSAGLGS